MDFDELFSAVSLASHGQCWKFVAEKDGKCCQVCRSYHQRVFFDTDPAMPLLPLHPNCRCKYVEASEEETAQAWLEIFPDTAIENTPKHKINELLKKLNDLYTFKIPKPPRLTDNKANWLYMTWMWFFEQGDNPANFSADSPESKDISESFSIQELKKEYFSSGRIPTGWGFTGPGSATGNYGEVE